MDNSGEKAPSHDRGYADPITTIPAPHQARPRAIGITTRAA
jgi:hypothetical protein